MFFFLLSRRLTDDLIDAVDWMTRATAHFLLRLLLASAARPRPTTNSVQISQSPSPSHKTTFTALTFFFFFWCRKNAFTQHQDEYYARVASFFFFFPPLVTKYSEHMDQTSKNCASLSTCSCLIECP
jgi:hypothetical protein